MVGPTPGDLPPLDDPRPEMRQDFHRSLDHIDDEFVGAALLVADALPRLTDAFFAGDATSIQDARAMALEVQERCVEVEDQGFVLLAREAPVSSDLRRLVSLLRLVTDVDRSASLLRHVSETLRRFDPRMMPPDLSEQVQELARRSAAVFRQGLDAWRRRDALAVHEVDELDEGVDRLQLVILDSAANHDGGDELLVIGLIARYYERIADHGVAMAQDATFAVTGERVKV